MQRSTGDEFVEPHEDDELDLNALTVKGKGSEDNCFFFTAGSADIALLSGENGIHDEEQGKEHGGCQEASITATIAQYGRGKCGYGNAETWKVGPIGSALCGRSVHLATWRWRRCSVRTGDDEVELEETVKCKDARP